MTATLVFDIETVPDVAGLRALHGYDAALADADVAELAFQRRRAQSGKDFLQVHLQRVVAISCVLRDTDTFRVWSLGNVEDDERTLIQRFFDGIEKYTPQLVSWNGGGFDLPVLHYRGLIHGVAAARYWELGEGDATDARDFRYNNYISRYHMRHVDLMDLLALFQPKNNVPLDQVAKLIGLPGKLGMDGSRVWDAYCAGRVQEIRDYCETDVVNTWLVFLRFQRFRGLIDAEAYAAEQALVRNCLGRMKGEHWQAFLADWPATA